ncbi:MAG: alpha-isopropylmalate synthase regulatory domain-containing protein [Patescibacteria group bacterium]
MNLKLSILDTTFRDGIQGENVEAANRQEIIQAIQAIDSLGVSYLELGFATANEAARLRITKALDLNLKAKVSAFGRTHPNDVKAILGLKVPVAVLVGKSRKRDAEISLRKTPEQNLQLIRDSITTLANADLEVIFDAEHFFQAFWEDDRDYALQALEAALTSGAHWIVLCDTNGKMTPQKIIQTITNVKELIPIKKLGIHTHNDRGLALANAEAAFSEGVCHIQGTIGGVGERTGNMDLTTFIPNICFNYGNKSFNPNQLKRLTRVYLLVCDALNITPDPKKPWVGDSAFYTEAGMHESGLERDPGSYFHANPELIGNRMRGGVTDQSGRANITAKAKHLGIDIPDDKLTAIAARHQELVDMGANFGAADASFLLFVLRELGQLPKFFEFVGLRITINKWENQPIQTEANLKMKVAGEDQWHNAAGDGPVNALDEVLRRKLRKIYPDLELVKLIDFKVRIIDAVRGTAAKVRVLVDFTDGSKTWTTMGVHENIIEACWNALLDSYTYKLLMNSHKPAAADATEIAVTAPMDITL